MAKLDISGNARIGVATTVIDSTATTLDCSEQEFGPGEVLVIVLSWWLSTKITGLVEELDISGNNLRTAPRVIR